MIFQRQIFTCFLASSIFIFQLHTVTTLPLETTPSHSETSTPAAAGSLTSTPTTERVTIDGSASSGNGANSSLGTSNNETSNGTSYLNLRKDSTALLPQESVRKNENVSSVVTATLPPTLLTATSPEPTQLSKSTTSSPALINSPTGSPSKGPSKPNDSSTNTGISIGGSVSEASSNRNASSYKDKPHIAKLLEDMSIFIKSKLEDIDRIESSSTTKGSTGLNGNIEIEGQDSNVSNATSKGSESVNSSGGTLKVTNAEAGALNSTSGPDLFDDGKVPSGQISNYTNAANGNSSSNIKEPMLNEPNFDSHKSKDRIPNEPNYNGTASDGVKNNSLHFVLNGTNATAPNNIIPVDSLKNLTLTINGSQPIHRKENKENSNDVSATFRVGNLTNVDSPDKVAISVHHEAKAKATQKPGNSSSPENQNVLNHSAKISYPPNQNELNPVKNSSGTKSPNLIVILANSSKTEDPNTLLPSVSIGNSSRDENTNLKTPIDKKSRTKNHTELNPMGSSSSIKYPKIPFVTNYSSTENPSTISPMANSSGTKSLGILNTIVFNHSRGNVSQNPSSTQTLNVANAKSDRPNEENHKHASIKGDDLRTENLTGINPNENNPLNSSVETVPVINGKIYDKDIQNSVNQNNVHNSSTEKPNLINHINGSLNTDAPAGQSPNTGVPIVINREKVVQKIEHGYNGHAGENSSATGDSDLKDHPTVRPDSQNPKTRGSNPASYGTQRPYEVNPKNGTYNAERSENISTAEGVKNNYQGNASNEREVEHTSKTDKSNGNTPSTQTPKIANYSIYKPENENPNGKDSNPVAIKLPSPNSDQSKKENHYNRNFTAEISTLNTERPSVTDPSIGYPSNGTLTNGTSTNHNSSTENFNAEKHSPDTPAPQNPQSRSRANSSTESPKILNISTTTQHISPRDPMRTLENDAGLSIGDLVDNSPNKTKPRGRNPIASSDNAIEPMGTNHYNANPTAKSSSDGISRDSSSNVINHNTSSPHVNGDIKELSSGNREIRDPGLTKPTKAVPNLRNSSPDNLSERHPIPRDPNSATPSQRHPSLAASSPGDPSLMKASPRDPTTVINNRTDPLRATPSHTIPDLATATKIENNFAESGKPRQIYPNLALPTQTDPKVGKSNMRDPHLVTTGERIPNLALPGIIDHYLAGPGQKTKYLTAPSQTDQNPTAASQFRPNLDSDNQGNPSLGNPNIAILNRSNYNLAEAKQGGPILHAPSQLRPDLVVSHAGVPSVSAPDQGNPNLAPVNWADSNLRVPNKRDPILPAPSQLSPNFGVKNQGIPNLAAPNHGYPDLPAINPVVPNSALPQEGHPAPRTASQQHPHSPAPEHPIPSLAASNQGNPNSAIPSPGNCSLALPSPGNPNLAIPIQGGPNIPVPEGGYLSVAAPSPEDPNPVLPGPRNSFFTNPGRMNPQFPTAGQRDPQLAIPSPGDPNFPAPSQVRGNLATPNPRDSNLALPGLRDSGVLTLGRGYPYLLIPILASPDLLPLYQAYPNLRTTPSQQDLTIAPPGGGDPSLALRQPTPKLFLPSQRDSGLAVSGATDPIPAVRPRGDQNIQIGIGGGRNPGVALIGIKDPIVASRKDDPIPNVGTSCTCKPSAGEVKLAAPNSGIAPMVQSNTGAPLPLPSNTNPSLVRNNVGNPNVIVPTNNPSAGNRYIQRRPDLPILTNQNPTLRPQNPERPNFPPPSPVNPAGYNPMDPNLVFPNIRNPSVKNGFAADPNLTQRNTGELVIPPIPPIPNPYFQHQPAISQTQTGYGNGVPELPKPTFPEYVDDDDTSKLDEPNLAFGPFDPMG